MSLGLGVEHLSLDNKCAGISQVIEIARKNVRAVCESLQSADTSRPTLMVDSTAQSIDHLKLYRLFQRVFSRMLWNGGRGLSDCLGLDQW